MTNGQIAEELQISLNTVKYHLSNAMQKLEVSDRGEVAARASRWRNTLGATAVLKLVGSAVAVAAVLIVLLVTIGPRDHSSPQWALVFAATDGQTWSIYSLDEHSGASSVLADLPPAGSVEGLSASADGGQVGFYLRPPLETSNCPPFASCPAQVNHADAWQLADVSGRPTKLAGGLEPNQNAFAWLGTTPLLSSVTPADKLVPHVQVVGGECFYVSAAANVRACAEESRTRPGLFAIRLSKNGEDIVVEPTANPVWPRVSPDGTHVAWNESGGPTYEIWMANLDWNSGTASSPKFVSDGGELWWSPDGARFAFSRPWPSTGAECDVWTWDIAAGTARQVTSASGFEQIMGWSPDSTSVLFSATYDDSYGELYSVEVRTGNVRRLTTNHLAEVGAVWVRR